VSALHIPQPHAPIQPGADDPPVREHSHRVHLTVVMAELDWAALRRIRVPHQHPPVVAAADHPPVRQHCHRYARSDQVAMVVT
jgi:hypothetical protein